MKVPTLTRGHLAAAVAIAFTAGSVAGLSWAFSEQIALSGHLREEEARLEAEVYAEETRNDHLADRLDFVQTDAFVEEWARGDLHMRKADERIVLLPRQAEAPERELEPAAPPEPVESVQKTLLQEVWEMLAGP